MKNLIAFLISCLSMTALVAQVKNECRVRVLSDDPTATVINLTFSEKIESAADFKTACRADGLTQILQEGVPDLPKFAMPLIIPNTGGTAVEVVGGQFHDIAGVEILPSKGDLKRTVDPATVPYRFGEAYSRDEFFPGRAADLQSPFVFRELRGQSVWIYPFQYNPVSKVLRVYQSLTLKVVATGGSGENELAVPPARSSRVFREIFQKFFANYSEARHFPDFQKGKNGAGGSGAGGDLEKMLVLLDDNLTNEIEPLLNWQREKGIIVEVAKLSEIGSSEPGDIFNFVKPKYEAEGYTYIMIVGDESKFKPEMRSNGGLYACDNCLGYHAGGDHFPEVLVGRLHARDAADLKTMVDRNLEYEKNPLVDQQQNWCATGMAAASEEGAGIGDDNQIDYEHGNEWKAKHLADGYEAYWEFYEGSQDSHSPTSGDPTADQPGNPQSTDLLAAMNGRGVGLWNYTGHGWEQGVVTGNFDVNSTGQMTNHGRYPFVIIVGCCSGNFTHSSGECLGEAMQRARNTDGKPTGAVTSFMSSDYQSWAPPMEGQDGMNQYLVDADGVNLTPEASAMLAYGNALMIAAYGNGGELMADFWNPFTDPSTMPRTRLPQVLTAQHVPSVFIGTTSLSITCPVEGAQISLLWQGEPIGTAKVVGGVASINFPALTNVGDITVTGTQFNYIPYQGKVQVVPASGPFVVSKFVVLDDAAGNSNGKADFGESLKMNVRLENVGLETATAISLEVSSSDPKITLTDGSEIFGDMAVAEGIERTAAFAFSVADDVADGHIANFKFKLNYSGTAGYEWVQPIRLNAPKLEIPNFFIDDALGGNGNGRFESGETVVVTVKNVNKGKADSPVAIGKLTSASPYLTIAKAVDLGKLAADGGSKDAVFSIEVAADAPKSQEATLQYEIVAEKYSAEKSSPAVLINAILEDWESPVFTTFPWEKSGSKPWVIVSTNAYEGSFCVRSGTITHNQQSILSLNLDVTEDGKVSFARRTSCEDGYDFLHFKIDGEIIGSWTGVQPWAEVSFPITKGLHKLVWSYEKDQFGSDGSDRVWVDEVFLPLHNTVVGTKNLLDERILDLAVLPNPAGDAAVVRFDLLENQEVGAVLIDQLGRQVRQVLLPQNLSAGLKTLPLDLAGLHAGVYFLRLQSTELGSAVVKFVKI